MKKNLLIPFIWLLIYPVIIPAALSNYVLCIGADGHVDFEMESNGRCTDAHPSHAEHVDAVFAKPTSQADHCGSCVDLPIFFSLDEQPHLAPSKNIPLNPPISSVVLVAIQTCASTTQNSLPILGPSHQNYPSPDSLRITPLLI